MFEDCRQSKGPTYLIQVIVEIWVAGTQITSQDRGVGREHSWNINMSSATDDQPDGWQPLVKMCHDVRRFRQPLPKLQSTSERKTWNKSERHFIIAITLVKKHMNKQFHVEWDVKLYKKEAGFV